MKMKELFERRKILLEREAQIVNKRCEIFKLDIPNEITKGLNDLKVESQTLYEDWWNLHKECMALPLWKLFVYNIGKSL